MVEFAIGDLTHHLTAAHEKERKEHDNERNGG